MLFLYRPRETWMPYRSPRAPSQQGMYNMELQQRFEATRRVPRPAPAPETAAPHERDTTANLKQLSDLHASGVLTDSEFVAAKARLTGTTEATA